MGSPSFDSHYRAYVSNEKNGCSLRRLFYLGVHFLYYNIKFKLNVTVSRLFHRYNVLLMLSKDIIIFNRVKI